MRESLCFSTSNKPGKWIYRDWIKGLYRDDGLAVFKNISGSQAEKFKKYFQNIFRKII